jgi:hypothetical protein
MSEARAAVIPTISGAYAREMAHPLQGKAIDADRND